MTSPTGTTGTTGTTTADMQRVADALADVVGQGMDLAQSVSDAVRPGLTGAAPRRADLSPVQTLVEPVLADPSHPAQGAGFVAAVDLLADARWWLEWFARDTYGRVQRLVTQSDPDASGFYDYEVLPWYTAPQRSGRPHVTGPYVDYLCTEEYTLTFSTPVYVRKQFVGIAAADVPVRLAEAHLLPALGAASSRLVVVNGDGRILSSNSGRYLCGDLLAPEDRTTERSSITLDGFPLTIVDLGA